MSGDHLLSMPYETEFDTSMSDALDRLAPGYRRLRLFLVRSGCSRLDTFTFFFTPLRSLRGRSPAVALREGRTEEVVGAVRNYLAEHARPAVRDVAKERLKLGMKRERAEHEWGRRRRRR